MRHGTRITVGFSATALLAGVMLAGCGGATSAGDSTVGGGGTGGGGGTREASVDFDTRFGSVDTVFLTGAGRAEGDLSVVIQRHYLQDAIGEVRISEPSGYRMNIASFDPPQSIPLNVPFTSGLNSRTFDTFTLDVREVIEDLGAAGSRSFSGSSLINNPFSFPGKVNLKVIPGRRTAMNLYLDPSMWTVSSDSGTELVTFNPDKFREANIPTDGDGKVRTFFSDYLSFDISQMSASLRPSTANGPAGRVFFSGDGYGLSDPGTRGLYEGLTDAFSEDDPAVPIKIEGQFESPGTVPGGPSNLKLPGTYTLTEPDPSAPDPTTARKLISFKGMWYEYFSRIKDMGSIQAISLPSSKDDNIQDLVVVQHTPTTGADGTVTYQVNNMYFGYVAFDFGTTGSNRGSVFLYPIRNLTNPTSIDGLVQGTVTSAVNASGAPAFTAAEVRKFTVSLSTPIPGIGNLSGNVLVYRK